MNSEPQNTTSQSVPLHSKEGAGVSHRMEWIDAMRGFTMLLVVAYHVSINGFLENPKQSFYLSSFVLFRMPLFFFISGFFSYSTKVMWSAKTLATLTAKKLRIQMLPTVIFFALMVVAFRPNFWDGCTELLHNPTKGGYWFTYALLLMFVMYYAFAYLESKCKDWLERRNIGWLLIAAFWLLWLGLYATWFMPSWFSYPQSEFMQWSSFGQVIQYFHFFLAGNIVRRYWTQFQRLFDTKWFIPTLIVLGTVCMCELFKWHEATLQWRNLPRTLSMYSLMLLVVIYFRHYAEAFSKQTRLGRTLQYIGVRTLDIYLLHFFFIPVMPFVGRWLPTIGSNFAIDITISFAGAFIITGITIIASNIIRTSPLLKYYLFGRK